MIFGREPAFWMGFLRALIASAIAFGLVHWSADQSAAALAIAAAVAAVVVGLHTRPFPPVLITHVGEAVLALVTAFRLHWTATQVSGLVLVVQFLVAYLSRQAIEPLPPENVWYHPARRRARV